MSNFFPDVVETDIKLVNTLSFQLPATAFEVDSDLIIEIAVEYGENPSNKQELIANAWAREAGGVISGFIAPVHLPIMKNEQPMDQAVRIVSALNESEIFQKQVTEFVMMLIRNRH